MRLFTLSKLCVSKLDQKPQQLVVKLRKPARLIRRKSPMDIANLLSEKSFHGSGGRKITGGDETKTFAIEDQRNFIGVLNLTPNQTAKKAVDRSSSEIRKFQFAFPKAKVRMMLRMLFSAMAETDAVMIRNTN